VRERERKTNEKNKRMKDENAEDGNRLAVCGNRRYRRLEFESDLFN
jgi:hypothetical protein